MRHTGIVAKPEHPLADDLERILSRMGALWEELRGMRLFLTGGTGFFGRWLLESLAWANDALDLHASALVLTRDAGEFQRVMPHLACRSDIRFHMGDIRDFSFPDEPFSHVVHAAATSAVATFRNEDPLSKFDTLVAGTKRALDFTVRSGARLFLLTSSGAVYGRLPSGMTRVSEDYTGGPDPSHVGSAWGEGKRAAEFLCAYYAQKYGMETKIARCFSFVGPHLPLDIHYAVGNFVRDGLNGGPIEIRGDGTPCRSYLYAADLVVWLWTILLRGHACRPYNVGSESGTTIAGLADTVARCFGEGAMKVHAAGAAVPGQPEDRYVPETRRAREELGLREWTSLEDGICRTIAWHRGAMANREGGQGS